MPICEPMTTKTLQPIDKIAFALIIILGSIVGLLLWGGNACGSNCLFHTGAKVSDFSWQNKAIGREDRSFILTFNRPMDRDSVEENLTITPPLPGKISWSGLRLAYTLDTPAPYGETYQVSLQQAQDRFAAVNQTNETIQPFVGEFRSRDRAFAYIGNQGEEQGRLVLFDWTKQEKRILTPDNLIVFDFEPYPQGDRLLFSAASKNSGSDALIQLQLYTVTTGLERSNTDRFEPQLQLVLDNQEYQNNKFDLSQDGKKIVVQRFNRHRPKGGGKANRTANVGLWAIVDEGQSELISSASGGNFLITPDSQTVAVAQGEGIALLPLQPDAEPIDFLPKFGQVLSFSLDGSAAAMINYNTDNPELRYRRSLFYVNNQGVQKELLTTKGSIIDCKFAPTAEHLYCLLTELEPGEEYRETPYLAKVNLKTGVSEPLLQLPKSRDSEISVAPDGLGVLFNKFSSDEDSSLWLLIPSGTESTNSALYNAEELPFLGLSPQWLP